MRIVQTGLVDELVSQRLGIPGSFAKSIEGLAEFARHIASFECPCSERQLVGSLARYLSGTLASGLKSDTSGLNVELAGKLVDGLLDHGDLIEVTGAESNSRLIALRAPAVCALSRHRVIVLGIVPAGSDSLPAIYRASRELKGYGRILTVQDSATVLNELHAAGYVVISEAEWVQLPDQLNAKLHLNSYTSRFKTDISVGPIEGLRVLDAERPVGHYKSRWISKPVHDGDFVARRQRQYGNEAWAFVRLLGLEPVSLIDFPTKNFTYRACDEAWHLQQAIDYLNGHPQRYRVIPLDNGGVQLRFLSPIPQWAHRRLTSLGEQVNAADCLFAYCFPSAAAAADEAHFVETRMWLSPL